jgi:CBS domain-containing protein
MSPRVHFGNGWVHDSVLEVYKEDIARFRVLMITDADDPFIQLKRGEVPRLQALQLHNGTVYRWNRACYGVTDGKPHLRIENRILPSGPSPVDEVANAAFWFGLVHGMAHRYDDIKELMAFDHAKSNFIAASRLGLGSQLMWFDGKYISAHRLICEELLPIAREGLERAEIDAEDIDKYLGLIDDRVRLQRTGAQWMLDSITEMKKHEGSRAERLDALVAGMLERQQDGAPVHTWTLASLIEKPGSQQMLGTRVEHYMTTEIFTVQEEELVEFVASLMDWQRIRHVIVEDNKHRLVGLVTHRNLLRYLATSDHDPESLTPVKDIMIKKPLSVSPATSTMDAIKIMRDQKVSALPVVQDGQLVGIITERDFLRIAGKLLDESMDGPPEKEDAPVKEGEQAT